MSDHPGGLLLFPVVVFFTCGFISGPTQLSIASRCVSKMEQGKLQGANGSLDTIGKIVGPLMAAAVFAPSARQGVPNAIFFFAAAALLPGVLVAFRLIHYLPSNYNDATDDNVKSGKCNLIHDSHGRCIDIPGLTQGRP